MMECLLYALCCNKTLFSFTQCTICSRIKRGHKFNNTLITGFVTNENQNVKCTSSEFYSLDSYKYPVIWVSSPTVNELPITSVFRSLGMWRHGTGWKCSWHFEGMKCLHLQGWSLTLDMKTLWSYETSRTHSVIMSKPYSTESSATPLWKSQIFNAYL